MTQAAHSEHAGPKSSLGSDDSERIASQFSLMYTTYSHIERACGCHGTCLSRTLAQHSNILQNCAALNFWGMYNIL